MHHSARLRLPSAVRAVGAGTLAAYCSRSATGGAVVESADAQQPPSTLTERPKTIQEAGDGPLPLDFKPGQGTEIIDHHMEVAERFYQPATMVSLDTLLQHEKKREHLRIYRDKPEKEVQMWEGGVPRFVRAPMHMMKPQLESRNVELPPGPVLHDTRTGVAIRVLGQMIPSPEMAVREDRLRSDLLLFLFRLSFWGWLFVLGFLFKFTTYMALRTKLRSQGIANPVLPQNRIKILEIIWFARQDFKQYKKLFDEFTTTHWIPYRRAKLREEGNLAEEAAYEMATGSPSTASSSAPSSSWFSGLWGGGEASEEKKSTIENIYVPEMGRSFDIDTSRVLIGMSPDGPVYAPPDAEVLFPEQLDQKLRKLKKKVVSQMDDDVKQWSSDSYDKRARDHANEFIVQFHLFLHRKGVITPLDPEKVDNMYELQSVPRVQDLGVLDSSNTGAAEGTAVRPQLVRVR